MEGATERETNIGTRFLFLIPYKIIKILTIIFSSSFWLMQSPRIDVTNYLKLHERILFFFRWVSCCRPKWLYGWFFTLKTLPEQTPNRHYDLFGIFKNRNQFFYKGIQLEWSEVCYNCQHSLLDREKRQLKSR